MIIFDSRLESWPDKTIKQHCQLEKEKSVPASAHFLIGSFCSDGDIHVAYTVRCPLPETAADSEGDKLSRTFDDEWMTDCAEKITRILPGGVHVVGVAWFSNKSVFMEQRAMLTRTVARIQRTNNSLSTLNITSIGSNMAIVYVETPNGKPQGIIVDVVKRGADSPTKVSFTQLEWISVVTNASAKVTLNISAKSSQSHFYNDIASALHPFAENLFSCDMVLIDGALRDSNEQLFKDLKKKKATSVEVSIFLDSTYNKDNVRTNECATNLHEITFDMEIRASVPARSKVEAVKAAAKQHLIRSLMARAELQYESMELTEDDPGNQFSLHQLPRPATTLLPCQGTILISDYLFEADTTEDAQKNFEEVLGLQTNIEHVDEGWERALLPEEMESVRQPLDTSPIVSLRPNDDDVAVWPILLALAVIVAVVSIIVYLVMDKESPQHSHMHTH